MAHIGKFELSILEAIRDIPEAYSYNIWQKVIQGRQWWWQLALPLSRFYFAFDKLEEAGLVTSWEGDPTPERGFRKKRFFKLTDLGKAALERAATP